jgi:large subunit ribosomal protein L31
MDLAVAVPINKQADLAGQSQSRDLNMFAMRLADCPSLGYNAALDVNCLFGADTMKKDIHPEYHEITIQMTDGTEYTTRSTYGEPGDVLRLDIDPKTHPAWTGQHRLVDSGGQVAKFNKRYANLGLK